MVIQYIYIYSCVCIALRDIETWLQTCPSSHTSPSRTNNNMSSMKGKSSRQQVTSHCSTSSSQQKSKAIRAVDRKIPIKTSPFPTNKHFAWRDMQLGFNKWANNSTRGYATHAVTQPNQDRSELHSCKGEENGHQDLEKTTSP